MSVRYHDRIVAGSSAASNTDVTFSVTLSAASWSNGSQTVSNANFLATGYAYLVSPAAQYFDDYVSARIYGSDVTTDSAMTFTSENTPSGDIVVNILRRAVAS